MNESKLKTLFLVLLGNAINALGITMFVVPSGIITGGTPGLALSFNHYFHIPISLFVLIFNVSMFILGVIVLGMRFAMTTLVSTFFYPVILGVFESIPALSHVTNDKMLCTICGGIMIGFSIGMVIRTGASTGGVDIPPLILNKKFGLPVSKTLYLFDSVILLLQMFFSDVENVIYGIVLVMTYSFVLDKVLLMGTSQTQVKIISKCYKEINLAIQTELDRGSTLIRANTGYFGIDQPVLLSVISDRELNKLNSLVMDLDPEAFIIINHVNEVKGRGFSMQKLKKSPK